MAVHIRPLADDADVQALAPIVGWAFGFPAEECPAWFVKAGPENVRVARLDGRIVGGLVELPMGQWFGGRSVPMVGIAGVAVAPEERGRGVALALMQSSVRALAEAGVALSTLYPATQTLYRAAGYEQAGTRFELALKPSELPVLEREARLERLGEADHPGVERAYAELAQRCDGYLDRRKYIWDRVREPRGERRPEAFGVRVDGALEGYLYVVQRRTHAAHYDLSLTDAVALTPRAGRCLLTFLAEHRTLAETCVWFGGPANALLALLPEQRYRITLKDQWMLRIVSVPDALEARGYPEGASVALDLELSDAVVPANAGRWRLEVEAGRGRLRRGAGDGSLKMDVRGLAALYSGYHDPFALERAGLAEGDERALRAAQLLFSGPAPCMPDAF